MIGMVPVERRKVHGHTATGARADVRPSETGIMSCVVEELLGRRLVAVERLSWQTARDSDRREVGPVRLVFDNGHGLVLSGSTDWTLDLRFTSPGDDSWLDSYDYDVGDGRWGRRNADAEQPFADAMGAALTDWQPVYNEVQEVVGVRLWFGGREVTLVLWEGEVTT